MKKQGVLICVLAMAFVAVWTVAAFAADPPASAPAAQCDKAKPAEDKPCDAEKGKAAAKPKVEVKCEMKGKLEAKTFKGKDGKEHKGFVLAVSEAKDADGKSLDALKGQTVRVGSRKSTLDIASFAGKDVTISGTLQDNKRLVPESIK